MLRMQPCQEKYSIAPELSSPDFTLPVSSSAFSVDFSLVSFTLTSSGGSSSVKQDEGLCEKSRPLHILGILIPEEISTHKWLAEDEKVASACFL